MQNKIDAMSGCMCGYSSTNYTIVFSKATYVQIPKKTTNLPLNNIGPSKSQLDGDEIHLKGFVKMW